MKSLLLSFVLMAATQVNAAQVELGKYKAVDADTKSVQVALVLNADATTQFNVSSPDFSVACKGKYAVNGNMFSANVACNSDLLPEASVKIDITNVNPQSLRSEKGAEVDVTIDALGDEPAKYLLKKAD